MNNGATTNDYLKSYMKNILIIDDDSRNIFALSAVLKAKGFQSTAASGMDEAFAMLHGNHSVDVILIDMMMPGMDGYEAIPKLKNTKELKSIPVVAVTAQAMKGDREKCLAVGADGYVSKPVDVDLLLNVLKSFVK